MLLQSRERHQIHSDPEPCSPARTGSHARDEHVQHGERGRRHQRDDDHLLNVQLFLGDHVRRNGDHDTLNNVLDGAFDQFAKIKSQTAHFTRILYYNQTKKYIS